MARNENKREDESKNRRALEQAYVEEFKKATANLENEDEKKEAVNKIINAKYPRVKIGRELIAAYITVCCPTDFRWLNSDDCKEEKKKYYNSAVVDEKNNVVYKKKVGKNNKALPKTERVYTGETEIKPTVNATRRVFLERYGITPKPTGFKANSSKEPVYNAFDKFFKDAE